MRLLIFLLILGCSPMVFADSKVATQLKELSPDISTIQSGGSWKRGAQHGDYRLIVVTQGMDLSRSLIYLQWLEYSLDEAEVTVLKSISIPEVNEKIWCFLSNVEFDQKQNAFLLEYNKRGDGTETPAESAKVYRATLTPTGFWEYEFVEKKD